MLTRDGILTSTPIEKTPGQIIFCPETSFISMFTDKIDKTIAHPLVLDIPTLYDSDQLKLIKTGVLPLSILTSPGQHLRNPFIQDHLLDEQNLRFNRSTHPRILCLKLQDQQESAEIVGQDMLKSMEVELQRSVLLDLFVNKLKSSTEYCVKLLPSKHVNSQLEIKPISQRGSQMQLDNNSVEAKWLLHGLDFGDSSQVIELCVCSKEYSMAIQKYIDASSEIEMAKMLSAISSKLSTLSTDKFGNYVIQKLVAKSPELLSRFAKLTLTSNTFIRFASNEYSSRIMQVCAKISSPFCSKIFVLAQTNFAKVVGSSGSTFLLSACIKHSVSESEYLFVLDYLIENSQFWLGIKLFKRVLVSIISVCSDQTIDRVFTELEGLLDNPMIFKEKYSVLLLVSLLQRGHSPSVRIACRLVSSNNEELLRMKHFRFFFASVVESRISPVLDKIFESTKVSIPLTISDRQLSLFKGFLLCSSADTKQFMPLLPTLSKLLGHSAHKKFNANNLQNISSCTVRHPSMHSCIYCRG